MYYVSGVLQDLLALAVLVLTDAACWRTQRNNSYSDVMLIQLGDWGYAATSCVLVCGHWHSHTSLLLFLFMLIYMQTGSVKELLAQFGTYGQIASGLFCAYGVQAFMHACLCVRHCVHEQNVPACDAALCLHDNPLYLLVLTEHEEASVKGMATGPGTDQTFWICCQGHHVWHAELACYNMLHGSGTMYAFVVAIRCIAIRYDRALDWSAV
jgi:hypothetical protein